MSLQLGFDFIYIHLVLFLTFGSDPANLCVFTYVVFLRRAWELKDLCYAPTIPATEMYMIDQVRPRLTAMSVVSCPEQIDFIH